MTIVVWGRALLPVFGLIIVLKGIEGTQYNYSSHLAKLSGKLAIFVAIHGAWQ